MDEQSKQAQLDGPAKTIEPYAMEAESPDVATRDVEAVPRGPDEEAPLGSSEKLFVEPQLVVNGDSQKATPTKIGGAGNRGLARLSSTVININQLPADVADNLRQFDINGDGMISLTELVHGAMSQQEQQEKVIFFRRLIIGFVVIWLLTMGAFFGVVYGAIEASKESKVDETNGNKGGATLVTKDNAYVVQTANSDFFVGEDGSAYVRTVTSQAYESAEGSSSGDDAFYNVMKTSAAQANITFSSGIPDDILMELKTISIRSVAGAHLNLQVLGVLRMPAEPLADFGAVTILTHIGRIVIDGTAVSFYDDTEVAIFENAGFIVTEGASVGGRRRLLDGIQALFGIFNAVASLKGWTGSGPNYANIPPPTLPANFIMHSRRFAPCIAHPRNDGSVTPYPGYLGGTLPADAGVDYCDLLQIDASNIATTYNKDNTVQQRFIETEYVIYRAGSDYLRVEYVHPLHPEVTYVEVLDNSDPQNPQQFHYNVDTATKGLMVTPASSDYDVVEFKGPIYYYNSSHVTEKSLVEQTLSSPFDYLGTTSYQGSDVRIWALHLMNNTVHAFWYDSVATRQVKRIDYGDFGMLDVVGLIPINDTEASSMSYLYTRPIAGLTTVVTGASNNLPYRTGINPYQPFVEAYRTKLAAQPSGSRRLYTEEEAAFIFGEGRERPVEVPEELLIHNAEADQPIHVPVTEVVLPRSHSFGTDEVTPPLVLQLTVQEDVLQETLQETLDETAATTAEDTLHHQQLQPDSEVFPAQWEHETAVVHSDHAHGKEVQARTCPTDWVGSDTMCYYFFPPSSSNTNSWDVCYALCYQKQASSMLCIQDATQNQFIYNQVVARKYSKTWLGLRRDTNNNYIWGYGCQSSYYPWNKGEPSTDTREKYAAMASGSGGAWMDEGVKAYQCACQNAFPVPSARPTTLPPTPAPTGTRAPTIKPTAAPTPAVITLRPTSAAGTRPLNLPQVSFSSDIAPILGAIPNAFGCVPANKCDNYFLWFSTINAPLFPVLTASGNDKFPCVYTAGISVPVIVPLVPVIEFSFTGGVEIAFCNDLSALDYVLGTVSVSVGITGLDFVQPPFDVLISWQVASVGIGITAYRSDAYCEADASVPGGVKFSNPEAYGTFRRIGQIPRMPQICRCLKGRTPYPGTLFVVGGPDIPGIVLSALPVFTPLAPFLLFTRITNEATLENFPYVCELALSRTSVSIDILMSLGIYSYTVSVFSFGMTVATKSGSTDFVGAYMDSPKGLDAFVSGDVFEDRFLSGAFNRAGNALISLVNRNAFIWLAVVALGGTLATAAQNYLKAAADGGRLLDIAAGDFKKDLIKLFEPPPVIVQGCFNPQVVPSRCTKRQKVFGKSFCVRYSMPEIRCGSTSQCIKYCS